MTDGDGAPAFHPDLTRARFMPRTSATRGNRRLLRAITRIGSRRPPRDGDLVDLGDGVTVRVQRPVEARATDAGAPRPAILHLHGGGLIIGSATQGDPLCRRVADELDVAYVPGFLDGVGGVPSMNLPDGIHPTPEGHERLTQNVLPELRELVEDVLP